MDQAYGLRTIMKNIPEERAARCESGGEEKKSPLEKWPRVISISSGKGGVGKTNIVANLALAFTQLQKKVLVLDADLGLANIDVLLGLTPRYTIEHLLRREKGVLDILIPGPGGMHILPASSGVLELAELDESQKIFLLNELELVAEKVDILLIDTGAGISSNVLYFNMAAEEIIVIVTPEPTSITDAYALIKVLSTKYHKKSFAILINSARNSQEAKEVFKKINRVVDRFLESLSMDYLGFIPYDAKLPSAVRHQKPVLEIYPQALSSRSFMELARILAAKAPRNDSQGSIQFFWKRLFQCPQLVNKNGRVD